MIANDNRYTHPDATQSTNRPESKADPIQRTNRHTRTGEEEFVYLAMKDAGIKVSRYYGIEIDPAARQLAKLLVLGIKHLKPHDVTKLPDSYLCQQGNNYDLVLLTALCQGFSVLPTCPAG